MNSDDFVMKTFHTKNAGYSRGNVSKLASCIIIRLAP